MADDLEVKQVAEANDVNMDYRKMKETHEKTGYREGVGSGRDAHLQQGFNEGFTHGATGSKEWGKLRGALSALRSIASSKSVQDSNQRIMTEIADLLTQVVQMETIALNPKIMQNNLEIKLNQNYKFSQYSERINYEFNNHQRAWPEEHAKDGKFIGNELLSAFQTLNMKDTSSGVEDVRGDSETMIIVKKAIKGSDLPESDTVVCAESHEQSDSLQLLPNTTSDDLEKLWARTFSLAEEIGISNKILLFVKSM